MNNTGRDLVNYSMIVLLLFRRDAAPIVEKIMHKIRIKTIQTWMESLANVEIQEITKIKNVY